MKLTYHKDTNVFAIDNEPWDRVGDEWLLAALAEKSEAEGGVTFVIADTPPEDKRWTVTTDLAWFDLETDVVKRLISAGYCRGHFCNTVTTAAASLDMGIPIPYSPHPYTGYTDNTIVLWYQPANTGYWSLIYLEP